MVGILPGGMNLPAHGRGQAFRDGAAVSPVAGKAAPASHASATTEAPAQTAPRAGPGVAPPPAPAGAGQGARLVATLLRMLVTPDAGDVERTALSDSTRQPAAPARATAAAPFLGLVAALLRLAAGMETARATGMPAETQRPAQAPQGEGRPVGEPGSLHPLPQDAPAQGLRTELAPPGAPAIAAGAAAAHLPPGAQTEQPSPRAELVPPGDGGRGEGREEPPVLAGAILALGVAALAAVLVSVF